MAVRIVKLATKWGRQLFEAVLWTEPRIPADRNHVGKGRLGDPICSPLAQLGWDIDRVDCHH